jgi:hypothetical protein
MLLYLSKIKIALYKKSMRKYILIIFLLIIIVLIILIYIIPGSIIWFSTPKICKEKQVNIFNQTEINTIKTKVYKLKSQWKARTFNVMSTLGKPNYIDCKGYSNENMLKEFDFMYETLINKFKTIYPGYNIELGGGKTGSPPGFHIFNSSGYLFKLPVASLHKDGQHINAGFTNYRKRFSFTIPIQLPENGGGLHIWKHIFANTMLPVWADLLFNKDKHSYIPYKEGNIAIHNGDHYHLIAPSKFGDTLDRITLQGHGVFNNDTLYLYW